MGLRVHHTAVVVADMEASLRFYREGLGLELIMDERFHSFFTDVDACLERLERLGIGDDARRITQPSAGGDVPMATVRDPDGVMIELVGRATG